MLQAIFYARFDLAKGPSIIHQHPPNSVIPSATTQDSTLLNFNDISAYVIPDYEFCNLPLSIATHGSRMLGYPISIEDTKYARNRFTFNVCFLLDEEDDVRPWTQVVKKTAMFFRAMEEESSLLDVEEELSGLIWAGDKGYPAKDIGIVYPLLEAVFEQMNAYKEVCVRVDDLRVLNLRLSRPREIPAEVHGWDVPLLTRQLPSPAQWTWDLALAKIHPHIDGIKHVRRIAELADVEIRLVKRTVRELLYHERAILLDIFHFQAIYAPTADFAWFAKDAAMQEECANYIAVDPTKNGLAIHSDHQTSPTPTKETILALYASLTPGLTVQDFLLAKQTELSNIDIRRFITFGVIKGFLRRIHKYALAITSSTHITAAAIEPTGGSSSPTKTTKPRTDDAIPRDIDRAWRKAALSSGWATPPQTEKALATGSGSLSKSARSGEGSNHSESDELARHYLNGQHCLDEVCVNMHASERKIVERLQSGRIGEVLLFNR
ncbi:nitrogen permease regulator 2 like protein [Acrodontium crateriforme]|uniref:Nitrogen permease regulator 2 like protein n=1 Tax=Acrodontium crateriforme TaxID=150365 RepID=A0AAQ3RB52_9PEZI|nr:nitrogen permease regulator 2 like protein [Acrodontium crateriforme]